MTPVTNEGETLAKKATPITVVAEATATPRTGEYHGRQKGRRVYHVEGAQPPKGERRGGRGRGHGSGCNPDARGDARAPTLWCDLHGEGPTRQTIAAP